MRPFKCAAFICLSLLACFACGKPDYNIDGQNQRIESYLRSQNAEYVNNSGAYRYTYHSGEGTEMLAPGDSVYFYFSGYLFTGAPRGLFATNIEADAESAGFDKTYMDFSPRRVVLGGGELISGLELGLAGSKQGDSLMVLMSSDLAYGDRETGIVKPGSSVAFKVVIDRIIK